MRRGEKVTVDVQVHTTGEAAIETVVTVENQTVELEVEATHIPENLEVSVEGLRRPARRSTRPTWCCPRAPRWSPTPRSSWSTSPAAITAEALEAELAEAEAEAGIEHEAPQAETEAAEAPPLLPRAPTRPEPTSPVGSSRVPPHGFHRPLADRRAGQPRPDVRR